MRLKEGDPFISFASWVASERLRLGCSTLQHAEAVGECRLHRWRLSRASSEQSNPSLGPRREYGAGNRNFSQKGLRARKSCHKHLFPAVSKCSLSTLYVPVSMWEKSVSACRNPAFSLGGLCVVLGQASLTSSSRSRGEAELFRRRSDKMTALTGAKMLSNEGPFF